WTPARACRRASPSRFRARASSAATERRRMSFRLFVYYCALCGGCTAYGGWVLGRLIPIEQPIVLAGLKGFFLGVLVAFGLGVVDGFVSLGLKQLPWVGLRAAVAGAAGAMGGLFGGV